MRRVSNRIELIGLFATYKRRKGVEIGVGKGEFSEQIAAQCPGVKLYSIDPWEPFTDPRKSSLKNHSRENQKRHRKEAIKRLSKYDNCEIIEKRSMDAVGLFKDGELGFAYIDGNHSFDYAIQDIIHWSNKVKSGGIVACHDYDRFRGPDVMEAVQVYLKCHKIHQYYVTSEQLPTVYWKKP